MGGLWLRFLSRISVLISGRKTGSFLFLSGFGLLLASLSNGHTGHLIELSDLSVGKRALNFYSKFLHVHLPVGLHVDYRSLIFIMAYLKCVA